MFNPNCPAGPPELRERFGFKLSDANRIDAALADVVPTLREEWRTIHGDN